MVPPCSDRISRVPPYSRIDWSGRIRGCHPLWPAFPDRSAYNQSTTGLLRFRSPLLAESRLMSVPPGTEMFQFPGFASRPYVFRSRYSSRSGLPHSDIHGSTPARGSPWLCAACHVLHRLLVPRHPPNALLVLETDPMHRSHPHPATDRSAPRPRHHLPRPAANSAHTRWPPPHHNGSRHPTPLNAGTTHREAATSPSRRKHVPVSIATAAAPRDAPEPDSP